MRSAALRTYSLLPPKCMIANCQDLDWQFGKNYGRKKIIIYFLTILHFFSTERREKRINRKRINFKTRRSFFLFPFFFPPPLSIVSTNGGQNVY